MGLQLRARAAHARGALRRPVERSHRDDRPLRVVRGVRGARLHGRRHVALAAALPPARHAHGHGPAAAAVRHRARLPPRQGRRAPGRAAGRGRAAQPALRLVHDRSRHGQRRGAARGRRERGRARRRARARRCATPEVEEAYQRDRAETRNPTRFSVKLGRTAASDGPDRYTAPSIVLRAGGRELVAPGFQPFEAVDVLVMNLVPDAERLPVPSLDDLLAAYPGGLTTAEVARVLADTTTIPTRPPPRTISSASASPAPRRAASSVTTRSGTPHSRRLASPLAELNPHWGDDPRRILTESANRAASLSRVCHWGRKESGCVEGVESAARSCRSWRWRWLRCSASAHSASTSATRTTPSASCRARRTPPRSPARRICRTPPPRTPRRPPTRPRTPPRISPASRSPTRRPARPRRIAASGATRHVTRTTSR